MRLASSAMEAMRCLWGPFLEWHQDRQSRGRSDSLWCGLWSCHSSKSAGQLVQQLNSLSSPLLMSMGGIPVSPSYAGLAPNYTGLYQFNVAVPSLPSGNATLTFSLGGTAGTQKLFIAVGN